MYNSCCKEWLQSWLQTESCSATVNPCQGFPGCLHQIVLFLYTVCPKRTGARKVRDWLKVMHTAYSLQALLTSAVTWAEKMSMQAARYQMVKANSGNKQSSWNKRCFWLATCIIANLTMKWFNWILQIITSRPGRNPIPTPQIGYRPWGSLAFLCRM